MDKSFLFETNLQQKSTYYNSQLDSEGMEHVTFEVDKHPEIQDYSSHKRKFDDPLTEHLEKKFPLKKRIKGKSPTGRKESADYSSTELLGLDINESTHSKHVRYEDEHQLDSDHKALSDYEENPLIAQSHNELSIPTWDDQYLCGVSSSPYSTLEDHPFVLHAEHHLHDLAHKELLLHPHTPHDLSSSPAELHPPLIEEHSTSKPKEEQPQNETDELIDIEDTSEAVAPLTPSVDNIVPTEAVDQKKEVIKRGRSKKRADSPITVETKTPKKESPKKTLVVRIKKEDYKKIAPRVTSRGRSSERKKDFKFLRKQLKQLPSGESLELCNILELVWKCMRDHPDAYPFLSPVQAKHEPEYYTIITKPMDLRTIHEKLVRYKIHKEFLNDVKLMVKNCHTYNKGRNPDIPPMADNLYKICKGGLKEMRDEIMQLEKKQPNSSVTNTAQDNEDEMVDISSSPLSVGPPDQESEFVDVDDSTTNIPPTVVISHSEDKDDSVR